LPPNIGTRHQFLFFLQRLYMLFFMMEVKTIPFSRHGHIRVRYLLPLSESSERIVFSRGDPPSFADIPHERLDLSFSGRIHGRPPLQTSWLQVRTFLPIFIDEILFPSAKIMHVFFSAPGENASPFLKFSMIEDTIFFFRGAVEFHVIGLTFLRLRALLEVLSFLPEYFRKLLFRLHSANFFFRGQEHRGSPASWAMRRRVLYLSTHQPCRLAAIAFSFRYRKHPPPFLLPGKSHLFSLAEREAIDS